VLAASVRRIDNSPDRLDRRMEMVLTELREMRAELRAMHAQQNRTAARVRSFEEERQ
jgi:chaperonin cofactor prefoldin